MMQKGDVALSDMYVPLPLLSVRCLLTMVVLVTLLVKTIFLFAWLLVLRVEEALSLTFESIDALPNESVYFLYIYFLTILTCHSQEHTLMLILAHVKMHRQVSPRGCVSMQMTQIQRSVQS